MTPTIAVTNLVFVGPGLTTADWSDGDSNFIGAGGAVVSSGNIICNHTGVDWERFLCPTSANDTVQIQATLQNCGTAARQVQIDGASWGIGFWTGTDLQGAPREAQCDPQTRVGSDQGNNGQLILPFAPNQSRDFTWTFPLPLNCPHLCLNKATIAAFRAANNGNIPEVIHSGGLFGRLQRICRKRACRKKPDGAPLGANGFFADCFGSNEGPGDGTGSCNDDAPLTCPDCYWRALATEQGSTNPDPATYGADPGCRCGCNSALGPTPARCANPGQRNRFCNQPPRSVFQGNVRNGQARVCLADILNNPFLWQARDNDACMRRRRANWGGTAGCYTSPIGPQVCMDELASPIAIQDFWADLTAPGGNPPDPCTIVDIEWETIDNGDGTFGIRVAVNGQGWTKQNQLPLPPQPDGEVWWRHDRGCP